MMYAMRKDRIMGDTRRRSRAVMSGADRRSSQRAGQPRRRPEQTRWETTGTKRRGSNPPRENDRPAALLQMGGGL